MPKDIRHKAAHVQTRKPLVDFLFQFTPLLIFFVLGVARINWNKTYSSYGNKRNSHDANAR